MLLVLIGSAPTNLILTWALRAFDNLVGQGQCLRPELVPMFTGTILEERDLNSAWNLYGEIPGRRTTKYFRRQGGCLTPHLHLVWRHGDGCAQSRLGTHAYDRNLGSLRQRTRLVRRGEDRQIIRQKEGVQLAWPRPSVRIRRFDRGIDANDGELRSERQGGVPILLQRWQEGRIAGMDQEDAAAEHLSSPGA